MEGVAKKGIKRLVKEMSANTPLTVPINPALGKCEWRHQNKITIVILCQTTPDVKAMAKHCHSRFSTKCSPKKEVSSGHV